jgi:hypothetical protein
MPKTYQRLSVYSAMNKTALFQVARHYRILRLDYAKNLQSRGIFDSDPSAVL